MALQEFSGQLDKSDDPSPTSLKEFDGELDPPESQGILGPTPVKTYARPVIEGLGMAGGILAGSPLGPYGAAGGAALGYAGGGAISDLVEQIAREREGPKSITDAIKRTGEHLYEGAWAEAGGRVINSALLGAKEFVRSTIRGLIAGQVKPISQEQQLIVDTAKQMGLSLRPSEVTGRDAAAKLEGFARRSIIGSKHFQKFDEENAKYLVQFYDEFAERSWGAHQSQQELGRLIQDAVKGRVIPDTQAVNKGLFQALARDTKDAPIVSSSDILPRARELQNAFPIDLFPKSHSIAARIAEIVSQPGPTTGLKVSKGEAVSGMEGRRPQLNVKTLSDAPRQSRDMNFMEAHDARSLLLELTRTGEVLSSRERNVAGNLAASLDRAMEAGAKKFDQINGTSVYKDWRAANESIKISHELFDSAIIKKALSATPEDVASIAFSKNAITETDRVMQAIGQDSIAKNAYRQSAFKELLRRSSHDGILDPSAMAKNAYGKSGVGEEVMNKTFGELAPQMRQFLTAASKMNITTAMPNTKTGQTGSPWIEQGMLISAVTAPVTAAAGSPGVAALQLAGTGAYYISMNQFAKLVNSPRGLNLLTRAIELKPKTREGARVGGLLLKELAVINGEEGVN
jgi:hypothetical protein